MIDSNAPGATRLAHWLHVELTLIAHELRAQRPFALAVLSAGVLLVWLVRSLSVADAGAIGASLPFFVPILGTSLLAFVAAEAFSRGSGAGLDRIAAAAPVAGATIALARALVVALIALLVYGVLTSMEPPPSAIGDSSFLTGAARSSSIGALVLAALAGIALRHGTAAAIAGLAIGAIPFLVSVAARGRHVDWESSLLARAALEVYFDRMDVSTSLGAGAAAILLAFRLRGVCARRPLRRMALAAAAGALFLAPGTLQVAGTLRGLLRVPFDSPGAEVTAMPVTMPDSEAVLVRVRVDYRTACSRVPVTRTSQWLVDPSTGERQRVEEGDAIDARRIGGPTVGRRTLRRGAGSPSSGDVVEYTLEPLDGSAPVAVATTAAICDIPDPTHLYFLDEEARLHSVSYADGTFRALAGVRAPGTLPALRISPDERWLLVSTWQSAGIEGSRPAHALVDLERESAVTGLSGTFLGWRRGPEPLVMELPAPNPAADWSTRTPGVHRIISLVGPRSKRRLWFARSGDVLSDLDGERWILERPNGEITIVGPRGAHLCTLRNASPPERARE